MDGDPKQRLLVLQILKSIATPSSLAAIKTAAKDADLQVALAAREVWRKLEPDALTPINEAVMDLDGEKGNADPRPGGAGQAAGGRGAGSWCRKSCYDIVMGNGEKPIPDLACNAIGSVGGQGHARAAAGGAQPDADDAKRAYAIRLAVEFKDRRGAAAVRMPGGGARRTKCLMHCGSSARCRKRS